MSELPELDTKKINIIAAFNKKRAIGYKNDLPWKRALSADLQWLKQLTQNTCILMGRKTFESLNNKPLPNRTNIVVTGKKEYDNVKTVKSLDEGISYCKSNNLIPVLLGGSKIFEEGLKYPCKVFFTILEDQVLEADVFFPEFEIELSNISEDVDRILKEKGVKCVWEFKEGSFYENGFKYSFFVGSK